jgi:tRNA threonylcarbamoyladenosine modification (KEOPS) complex  Pcc1 subunit
MNDEEKISNVVILISVLFAYKRLNQKKEYINLKLKKEIITLNINTKKGKYYKDLKIRE